VPHSLRLTHLVVRVAVVALLAITAIGATAALRAEAVVEQVPPDAARAMWVWDTSHPQAVVDLAVARGIGQLYAAVPPNVGTSPQLAQLTQLSTTVRTANVPAAAKMVCQRRVKKKNPGWLAGVP